MKKAIKYFIAVLAAAILCLALVACGENADGDGTDGENTVVKYTFKEAKMQPADPSMEHSEESAAETERVVNNIYKDSYIEFGDGKIVWSIRDATQKMTYTKEGDRYMIGGEYFEMIKQQFPGDDNFFMYAEEAEDGLHIVEVQPDATMTYYFIKA